MTATTITEPKQLLQAMLRNRMTDYNSTNRTGVNWIYSGWPRKDLKKNSYPRISLIDAGGTGEVIDIRQDMLFTNRIQIDVWVWGDDSDPMTLTIDSETYEGQKLLDKIGQDLRDRLNTYKSDFYVTEKQMFNLKVLTFQDMGPDPDRKDVIRKRMDINLEWVKQE